MSDCAWIITAPKWWRTFDPESLPFRAHLQSDQVRRGFRNDVQDLTLNALLWSVGVDVQVELKAIIDALSPGKVLGMLKLRPLCAYDPTRAIGQGERSQLQYWSYLCPRVQSCDFWIFTIEATIEYPGDPCGATPNRLASRVFRTIPHELASVLLEQLGDVPAWARATELAILLPTGYAALAVCGAWDSLVLPSPLLPQPWGTPKWFQDMLEPDLISFMRESQCAAAVIPRSPFDLSNCGELADVLRSVRQGVATHESLIPWIVELQMVADGWTRESWGGYRSRERLARIVNLVLFSDYLKSSDQLMDAMLSACQLALPPVLWASLQKHFERAHTRAGLDKANISRHRLTIDVAMMSWRRRQHWQLLQDCASSVHYMTWDSSPQYGRDYQLVVIDSISEGDLIRCFRMACEMYEWALDVDCIGAGEGDIFDKTCAHMAAVDRCISRHAPPAVLIGFGASSFGRKLSALLHSLRLEHFNADSLAHWCKGVAGVFSDDGTERVIGQVSTMLLRPWFSATSIRDIELIMSAHRRDLVPGEARAGAAQRDDIFEDPGLDGIVAGDGAADAGELFEDPDPPPPGASPVADDGMFEEDDSDARAVAISFGEALHFTGLHHIVHNAAEGLGDVMPCYEEHIEQARSICRLLRRSSTRPKILERLFNGPVSRRLRPLILAFKGHIFPGRWGTVAFSVPEILAIRGPLVFAWNKEALLHGVAAGNAAASSETDICQLVDSADSAIQSSFWWAWMEMCEELCSGLRSAASWIEGCSCHSHVLKHCEGMPAAAKEKFARCPMRTRRAAELSNGDFVATVSHAFDVHAAELAGRLRGVTARERLQILDEFDLGRAHLLFYFTMKVSHWSGFPWRVVRISHYDAAVARQAMCEALESSCCHPILPPWPLA